MQHTPYRDTLSFLATEADRLFALRRVAPYEAHLNGDDEVEALRAATDRAEGRLKATLRAGLPLPAPERIACAHGLSGFERDAFLLVTASTLTPDMTFFCGHLSQALDLVSGRPSERIEALRAFLPEAPLRRLMSIDGPLYGGDPGLSLLPEVAAEALGALLPELLGATVELPVPTATWPDAVPPETRDLLLHHLTTAAGFTAAGGDPALAATVAALLARHREGPVVRFASTSYVDREIFHRLVALTRHEGGVLLLETPTDAAEASLSELETLSLACPVVFSARRSTCSPSFPDVDLAPQSSPAEERTV